MLSIEGFKEKVFSVDSLDFDVFAMELFRFQAKNSNVFRKYIEEVGIDPENVKDFSQIPFIPVELFKSQAVKTARWEPVTVFESSGTTGRNTSHHYIEDLEFYRSVTLEGFKHFYGEIQNYTIMALLPSYLERGNSSLVVMIEYFIRNSGNPGSGFYLDNPEEMINNIKSLKNDNKVLLFGATFALLDLAEKGKIDLNEVIIMETGGMKGRREEMIREEVHSILTQQFNVDSVHSEYGMTEMMSQAYSSGKGLFHCPPWMKVVIRDLYDPFRIQPAGVTGGINIIDLSNVHSCSFIETQDIGRKMDDNGFEILGRMDNSDVRGCNLLVI